MKENLIFIISIIVFTSIHFYFKGVTNFEYSPLLIKIFIFVVLVWNIPAIILLIHFYIENKDTKFEIDTESDVIIIEVKGLTKQYKLSEIDKSTYNLGIYHKNSIDNKGRFKMHISDFGYWAIQFNNGDKFYFTNLLHDFLHDKPFIKKTKYNYWFYPIINKHIAHK